MATKKKKTSQLIFGQVIHNRKITKHNDLIQAHYQLSLMEHKLVSLFGCMVSGDKNGDTDFYEISAKDLCNLIGLKKTNNYKKHIEKVCKKLKKRDSFRIGNVELDWIASAKYLPSGNVSFEFSQRLKPYFIYKKDSHFTRFYVSNILGMKHKYSPKLYELHRQFYPRIKQRIFAIDELQNLLGIEEDKHKSYNDLVKDVIDPSVHELYHITDIGIKPFIARKKGKKVTHIGFAIFKGKRRTDVNGTLQEALKGIDINREKRNLHTNAYNNRYEEYKRDLDNFPENDLPAFQEYLGFMDMKVVRNPMHPKGKHIVFKAGSQGELDFYAGKEIKRMKFIAN